jgi:steroid 5-alpha reductase family enzyme
VLATSVMAALWVVQVRVRDASHVDVAWAVLVACCAIMYALLAGGDTGHRVLAAALASLWGFRLGGYLLVDRVLGKEEDGRYRALRARWGQKANRNFLWFFEAQALFVVFFSLPFAFIAQNDASGLGLLEWVGIAVWAVGNVGTIVADRHLARWRANPERLRAAACGAGHAIRTTSSSSRPGAEPRSSRARRRGAGSRGSSRPACSTSSSE